MAKCSRRRKGKKGNVRKLNIPSSSRRHYRVGALSTVTSSTHTDTHSSETMSDDEVAIFYGSLVIL